MTHNKTNYKLNKLMSYKLSLKKKYHQKLNNKKDKQIKKHRKILIPLSKK